MPLDANPLQEIWTAPQGTLFPERIPEPSLDVDLIIIACSGGKDSVALILDMLHRGVPPSKMVIFHHLVDGNENPTLKFDWPVTSAYVKALAKTFDIPLIESWRVGGFERELMKTDDKTAPVRWKGPDGVIHQAGGIQSAIATRKRYPQVSADLRVRWCSGVLKIDVADFVLRHDPLFAKGNFIFLTGERREESANRATYQDLESHRTENRRRRIHHWRPVLRWPEARVWGILQQFGVIPHPSYTLGWSRTSCASCIFGSDQQWADYAQLMPDQFEMHADNEESFGWTIRRTESLRSIVARTKPNALDPDMVRQALSQEWDRPILIDPALWTMPSGAFKAAHGPS
jgi:3'-phosphoadenosine 5'-phosphosulfate sulfotransferase (PAPS reductase)/FAD synthetase